MLRFTYLSCLLLALVANPTYAQELIFSDSFESGDLSATNEEGFRWASPNRTSLVTQLPDVGDTVIFNGDPVSISVGFTRDWLAIDEQVSMRFRYPAGEAMAEQRFNLGAPHREVWITFWLKVPENFSYPVQNVNKFFALWNDGYSADGVGSTIWLGMHQGANNSATLSFTYSPGGNRVGLGYQQSVRFITLEDRGKWMQIALSTATESSPGASNGYIETYRRWEGKPFEKLHSGRNLPIKVGPNSESNGFRAGYILGWANAAYTRDTEWLLDLFQVWNGKPPEVVDAAVPTTPGNFSVEAFPSN